MGTDLGEAGNLSCPWLRTVYALLEINLEDAQDLAKLRFWSAHAHWGADPPVCVCVWVGVQMLGCLVGHVQTVAEHHSAQFLCPSKRIGGVGVWVIKS